jgi:hypothetical protein
MYTKATSAQTPRPKCHHFGHIGLTQRDQHKDEAIWRNGPARSNSAVRRRGSANQLFASHTRPTSTTTATATHATSDTTTIARTLIWLSQNGYGCLVELCIFCAPHKADAETYICIADTCNTPGVSRGLPGNPGDPRWPSKTSKDPRGPRTYYYSCGNRRSLQAASTSVLAVGGNRRSLGCNYARSLPSGDDGRSPDSQ